MATRIDHGPPGSYKSFSLVMRFAIPALIEGRTIISNIRDFHDIDLIQDQFPDIEIPDSAKIICIPQTQSGNYIIARFFHWAPPGAAIFCDEAQIIWPAKRRNFRIEDLDHWDPPIDFQPDCEYIPHLKTPDGATVNRPPDILAAFEMQRHWNWDLFISTPNIDKLHDFIRQTSEWAYRHRDVSGILPGWRHTWMESQHDPETSGKAKTHVQGTPTRYKADARAFRCYSSTATGEHVANRTGRGILQDGKIRFVLGAIVLSFLVFIVQGWRWYSQKHEGAVPLSVDPSPVAAAPVPAPAHPATPAAHDSPNVGSPYNLVRRPILATIVAASVVNTEYPPVFLVTTKTRSYKLKFQQLVSAGYSVTSAESCDYDIFDGTKHIDASCNAIYCRGSVEFDGHIHRIDCDTPERELKHPARQSPEFQHVALPDNIGILPTGLVPGAQPGAPGQAPPAQD
ncbi:MAG: zonular occludens toxin domain-containing protein [Candidatus Methylumidiphilus sp.]